MTKAKSKRQPAKRPAARTVTASIDSGDFAGWEATARADFPARVLIDLDSGEIGRIVGALDSIVVSHNMPNEQGELAERMSDVDPVDGMIAISTKIIDGIAKLPPR